VIVYYIANDEKPKNAIGVRFFLDSSTARDAAFESHMSVYQFEVNDKCVSDNFGMDTIMVFKNDPEYGLKFVASGRWVEVHNVLGVPFYYDFEKRSPSYVTMSLHYFLEHYRVVPSEGQNGHLAEKPTVSVPDTKKAPKKAPDKPQEPLDAVDELVLDELFGPAPGTKQDNGDLTKMLF